MSYYLHFTFGPVQSFVAQARRTRDLYAGSLLLSHLALVAMQGLPDPDNQVVLPNFKELREIATKSEHASAPNRFKAEFVSKEAAIEAAHQAQAALQEAWLRIAGAVWEKFLKDPAAKGQDTEAIWKRQVENFWQIAWIVTEGDESDALDRRKNWQTYWPPEEPGDHCVLMGQWQELSGYLRAKEREKQDAFWKEVREKVEDLDLEQGERLCAIAFIKRFFPLVAKKAIGRELNAYGWPSTVTIAALPWLRKVAETPAAHDAAHRYLQLVRSQPGALVTRVERIKLLHKFPENIGDFARLSGNFLNRTTLANEDSTSLKEGTDRRSLLSSLDALEKVSQDRPGNFYALLLMDGDSMGALIRTHGAEQITKGLTQFAGNIPSEIYHHDGVTIYAGGDDLLALLPLDRALEAAIAARKLYQESFDEKVKATLSGTIVFAHYRCTFSHVLTLAHKLLDEVAKDLTGRDALAIQVLKPSGETCVWSAPFDHLTQRSPHLFTALIQEFGNERSGGRKTLSSSLLYKLRDRFSEFAAERSQPLERESLVKLFTAEALIGKRERSNQASQTEKTESVMNQLLDVCEIVRRKPKQLQNAPEATALEYTSRYTLDGLRLVKFLALDGKEGAE